MKLSEYLEDKEALIENFDDFVSQASKVLAKKQELEVDNRKYRASNSELKSESASFQEQIDKLTSQQGKQQGVADVDALKAENSVLTSSLNESISKFNDMFIANELTSAAQKHGVKPEAIDIVTKLGGGVFSVEENTVLGKSPVGELGEGFTADDFVKQMKHDKSFLFESSNGVGVGGGREPSAKNPFKKGDGFNVTEQARLRRDNPAEAERLSTLAK